MSNIDPREDLPKGCTILRCRDDDAVFFLPHAADISSARYNAVTRGNALLLVPSESFIRELEALPPENAFCESLYRFRALPVEPENMRLFTRALKRLDGDKNIHFEKALRQRAAIHLRLREGGGGLYACAVILSAIRENTERSNTL